MEVNLIADSPKKAFYTLRIVECLGKYSVEKESGAAGHVLDKRTWPAKNLDAAGKRFNRILKKKIDPGRKSPRKYKGVGNVVRYHKNN